MPDIITEVKLPSRGLLYGKQIAWENQLRAPKLKDRGLGDTTRRYKLQANILDKTLAQPLGMSAYDLHTADFVYLNLRQRQLSKGNAPYKISVQCSKCKEIHNVDVALDSLEVKYLDAPKELEYTTLDEKVLKLTFLTPRMFDECIDRAQEYLEEYKEAEMSFEDVKVRELLRFVILSVDNKKLTPPQMTEFIDNMYIDDTLGILDYLQSFDFGVQFVQTMKCNNCGKTIRYTIPVG